MATPIAMALSKLEEVKQRLQDPMDKKTELISYWINTDTAACWMTLIHQLDIIEETKLVETVKPSTQRRKAPTVNPQRLLRPESCMDEYWDEEEDRMAEAEKYGMLETLLVPTAVVERIRTNQSYITEEERRTAGLQYYLDTVPGASWARIAGALWYMGERAALARVWKYLVDKPVDPTLTLSNVIEALEDMPVANLRAFAVLLNIPWPKVKKVFSRFSTSTERKNEIVRIYLTQHPHPAWIHISDALYQFGGVFNNEQYHTVLMKIRSMYPTASL